MWVRLMNKIKKCPSCGSYALADTCSKCGVANINPDPPKYSPEDRYGDYRRELKKRSRGN